MDKITGGVSKEHLRLVSLTSRHLLTTNLNSDAIQTAYLRPIKVTSDLTCAANGAKPLNLKPRCCDCPYTKCFLHL